MPINVNTSNYINNQTVGAGHTTAGSVSITSSDGAVVSVKGLDLQPGQTLSGQVVEIDGKDIKLLLSNNQTINAKLEGNINALLGQTLSFEVKGSENGQTALRPLYTNLNTSQTVSNALQSAGLPVTDNYAKMVSSMMDEGMPINKNAIYDMSKQINNFPNANPDTIVKLSKLGLQVNELTINQYENYKGLEHQIIGDVDNISKGLTDLMNESLMEITDSLLGDNEAALAEASKTESKNLLSAFLNALTGGEKQVEDSAQANSNASEALNASEDAEAELASEQQADNKIEVSVFDTSKMILDMIDTSDIKLDSTKLSEDLMKLAEDIVEASNKDSEVASEGTRNIGKDSILRDLAQEVPISKPDNELGILDLAKNIIAKMNQNPETASESLKQKMAQLLSNKEFSGIVKDNLSKQMLLKPEEVVNSKNINDLYMKISEQANKAIEIMQNSGKENPELLSSAKNISDNVTFMNELNQVATYVQLPLLMNNKSAHGDLYVYTNKNSLKNNDGNVSALLHLDMDNLGPMDIYVALTNNTKLNTHFYLQDEATIDFIEAHIDLLNKRLTEKGYDMSMNISVKDRAKGPVNMSKEFMKDDPASEGISASKFSFDVRA